MDDTTVEIDSVKDALIKHEDNLIKQTEAINKLSDSKQSNISVSENNDSKVCSNPT